MSDSIILWCWKPIGYTPVQCIEYVINNDKYNELLKDKKISYACRLDPMACGILPLIIAPKETIRSKCESLQSNYKTYQFSMIKGIKTDSYDILGIPQRIEIKDTIVGHKGLDEILEIKEQKYPIYSSKTVKDPKSGKMRKLFEFANEDRIGEIIDIIPSHPIDIKYIKQINNEIINGLDLINYIKVSLDRIKTGDFRIDEVVSNWTRILEPNKYYEILSFEAQVSSGTYIRGLVNEMGGTAFNICRIGVEGNYVLDKKIDPFNGIVILSEFHL